MRELGCWISVALGNLHGVRRRWIFKFTALRISGEGFCYLYHLERFAWWAHCPAGGSLGFVGFVGWRHDNRMALWFHIHLWVERAIWPTRFENGCGACHPLGGGCSLRWFLSGGVTSTLDKRAICPITHPSYIKRCFWGSSGACFPSL